MTEKIILDVLVVIWLVSWLVFIANKDVILFCSYQLIENNYDPIIVLARKYNINSIHFTGKNKMSDEIPCIFKDKNNDTTVLVFFSEKKNQLEENFKYFFINQYITTRILNRYYKKEIYDGLTTQHSFVDIFYPLYMIYTSVNSIFKFAFPIALIMIYYRFRPLLNKCNKMSLFTFYDNFYILNHIFDQILDEEENKKCLDFCYELNTNEEEEFKKLMEIQLMYYIIDRRAENV